MKTFKTLCVVLMSAAALAVSAQKRETITVTGTVVDEQSLPLPGVFVQNIRSGASAATAHSGVYTIKAALGDTLRFSFLGYETIERTVDGPRMDVAMVQGFTAFEEAAVVGYGVQRQQALTGNVAGLNVVRNSSPTRMPVAADMAFFTADEEYGAVRENRFVNVGKDPLSTFALEADGASYSNVRRMINAGQLPPAEAVRVEEFVNYFTYDYEEPAGREPLKINYEVGPCPWNTNHKLVRIGIKAREIPTKELPRTNFVFLIDVSGSMYGPNRLPLVISSLKLLVNNLRPEDRVAIVTYAGSASVALPSTPASDPQKIRDVLDGLTAGGSTAGGAGIKMAYDIARRNFIEGGNNRVILATDGDFNVGESSDEAMETLIERERKSGVFLTVLGYGMGNYKDKKMQVLAEKGNGNYAYIDNLQEANRVLVNEFGGTMHTVAKDVKLQVEFNPARVASFRLVGYESRLLEHEDFNDDTRDAGEIGAGHTVTALYEIVPVGSESGAGSIDPLKYQTAEKKASSGADSRELMTVKIRYKEPDGDTSRKIEVPVVDRGGKPSEDFRFVSAVAMFAQLLRDSDFKGDATYEKVAAEARAGLDDDPNGYRREFVRLVQSAEGLN